MVNPQGRPVRCSLPAIALASALLLSGCGATSTATPDGNVNITISGLDPNQLGQVPGLNPGQIPGQIPLAPGTDPNAGGLPPLPPLAPGTTPPATDPTLTGGAPGGLTGSVSGAIPTAPAPASLTGPTSLVPTPVAATSPASPGTTPVDPAALAAAPAAPQATPPTGGQPAPNPLTPSAQAISNQFGVRLAGYPDAQGLANLNTALSLYPPGATAGATIHFTGQNAGSLGGTWQTGGLVTLYQTGVHTCAHELAHHIVEQNRARWGSQLKYLLRLDGDDFPQSPYAVKNAQLGNFEEVAAETVSYYAEGKWKPTNPQLEALLRAMITNQPGATA